MSRHRMSGDRRDLDEGLERLRKGGVNPPPPDDLQTPPPPPPQQRTSAPTTSTNYLLQYYIEKTDSWATMFSDPDLERLKTGMIPRTIDSFPDDLRWRIAVQTVTVEPLEDL